MILTRCSRILLTWSSSCHTVNSDHCTTGSTPSGPLRLRTLCLGHCFPIFNPWRITFRIDLLCSTSALLQGLFFKSSYFLLNILKKKTWCPSHEWKTNINRHRYDAICKKWIKWSKHFILNTLPLEVPESERGKVACVKV